MYKFFLKLIILFLLISSLSFSTENSSPSHESSEIYKIKKEISILKQKLAILEKAEKSKISTNSPKIALVLSGGGAKGLAHIGVIRELEKNNIPIDFIVGTSFGAIIGALYSAGYSPDEIEALLYETDFTNFFEKRNSNRQFVPFEKRVFNINPTVTLRYDNNFNFYLPKGINTSNDVYFVLKNLLSPVNGITDFNKLPIPLRIMATNLNTGDGTLFKSGDLAKILAASSAIPTVFSPVNIDGIDFVDGMIARNYPVSDAFNLGADIVIGSDVGVILNNDSANYNLFSTFSQILALSSANSSKKERELATFHIAPNVNSFSPTDFSPTKEIIRQGEIAAMEVIPNILKKIPHSRIENFKNIRKRKSKLTGHRYAFIRFSNIEFLNTNIDENIKIHIFSLLNNKKNKDILLGEFQEILATIQGFPYIEKLFYTIDKENEVLTLDIVLAPTNTVNISGNFRSDYGTTFRINTDIFALGRGGSLTDLSLKFGDYYGVAINNFSYYGSTNKIGLFSSISFDQSPLYLYRNNHKEAKYIINDSKFNLGISYLFNNTFSATYGVSIINSNLNLDTGDTSYNKLEFNKSFGNTFLNINYDTLDNISIPRKGSYNQLTYTWGGTLNRGDSVNFYGPTYSGQHYFKATNDLSFNLAVAGGVIKGDSIPETKYLKIGGLKNDLSRQVLSFSGYYHQNLLVDEALIFRTGFNYKLPKNFYIFGNYDVGTFNGILKDNYSYQYSIWNNYVNGVELGITYSSFLGPLSFSLSKNDSRDSSILAQFSLGFFID